MKRRLFVVEDRESLRGLLTHALTGEGFEVEAAADSPEALARLAREPRFELVLTDLKLPSGSGLDVLAAARGLRPAPAVVVLTGYGTVRSAVEAMQLGAADFLEKPVELEQLFALVRTLLGSEERQANERFEVPGAPPIVGAHPRLRTALRMLERVAPTESTVLLTGESGTGKELFARALHALSPRRGGPFVAVNCAAIPETLVEAELFGHEKGAFTGADRRRPGRFELASGGTLFLDEVGDLPLAVQAKVLRVLDDRRYERVGGGATLVSDVRLVAATNRRLAEMVAAGSFRGDLLYRLEIFPIELPALHERASDVPILVRHLLGQIGARLRLEPPEIDAAALAELEAAPWPGNVRQLANVLERAVVLEAGGRVGARELRPLLHPAAPDGASEERERVRQALLASSGDKRRAAELLGVSYRTLLRRVEKLDLAGYPKYRS